MRAIPCWVVVCGVVSPAVGCAVEQTDDPTCESCPPEACSIPEQNRQLYELMRQYYLWYDRLPEIDPLAFESPEALLDALRYAELDRFSYLDTVEEHGSYFEEGTYVGFGYVAADDDLGDTLLARVYEGGPMARAGARRGDRVVAINGVAMEDIVRDDSFEEVAGPNEVGVQARFSLERSDGTALEVDVVREAVTFDPVQLVAALEVGDRRIGYVDFDAFIEPANERLVDAFRELRVAQVDDLILDLRYNGGGRVRVARLLAELIAGDHVAGEVFTSFEYNDKRADETRAWGFGRPAHPDALDLDRVVIITSESSCSASELVANSLRPFIDVVLVGSRTCGKPVGTTPRDFCGLRLSAIEFATYNADGEGDYFDGLETTCPARDELTRTLGDVGEASLAEALAYLRTGTCSSPPQTAQTARRAAAPRRARAPHHRVR